MEIAKISAIQVSQKKPEVGERIDAGIEALAATHYDPRFGLLKPVWDTPKALGRALTNDLCIQTIQAEINALQEKSMDDRQFTTIRLTAQWKRVQEEFALYLKIKYTKKLTELRIVQLEAQLKARAKKVLVGREKAGLRKIREALGLGMAVAMNEEFLMKESFPPTRSRERSTNATEIETSPPHGSG